ncbi:MAG: HRDC domain-containing protein [Deltaproteobacteria bacterium]|nr:HRDC domain-containing protein [Deltaproteobacteria bacterium]
MNLRFDPKTVGFDDNDLQEFANGREILNVYEHFFFHDQIPRWVLLISYRDSEISLGEHGNFDKKKDWRADLSDEERILYDGIRRWRNNRAQREGRPPYILLTNQQMAEIAKKRPKTVEALREIPGVGEAKAAGFGSELVALLAAQSSSKKADSSRSEKNRETPDGT